MSERFNKWASDARDEKTRLMKDKKFDEPTAVSRAIDKQKKIIAHDIDSKTALEWVIWLLTGK